MINFRPTKQGKFDFNDLAEAPLHISSDTQGDPEMCFSNDALNFTIYQKGLNIFIELFYNKPNLNKY